jgi:hypothetical protein
MFQNGTPRNMLSIVSVQCFCRGYSFETVQLVLSSCSADWSNLKAHTPRKQFQFLRGWTPNISDRYQAYIIQIPSHTVAEGIRIVNQLTIWTVLLSEYLSEYLTSTTLVPNIPMWHGVVCPTYTQHALRRAAAHAFCKNMLQLLPCCSCASAPVDDTRFSCSQAPLIPWYRRFFKLWTCCSQQDIHAAKGKKLIIENHRNMTDIKQSNSKKHTLENTKRTTSLLVLVKSQTRKSRT